MPQGTWEVPVTGTGENGRPSADVVGRLQGPTCVPGKRRKRDALRAAFLADKDVVKKHAQWRNPELKPRVQASRSSGAWGAEAACYAWVAGECN